MYVWNLPNYWLPDWEHDHFKIGEPRCVTFDSGKGGQGCAKVNAAPLFQPAWGESRSVGTYTSVSSELY